MIPTSNAPSNGTQPADAPVPPRDWVALAQEAVIRGRTEDEGRRTEHPALSTSSLPPLPDSLAEIDPTLSAGGWVAEWVAYVAAKSPMTPPLFSESGALWMAAVAIARRLKVETAFGSIYPNLFAVWVAPTTLYHKTTAFSLVLGLLRRVCSHLLAPQDATPEALIADMAGQEPANMKDIVGADLVRWQAERRFAAQRGWALDEISGLMANAGKDYSKNLLESLLRFYDCEPEYVRSTRNQGRITVRNAYLSLFGASTPVALAPYLAAEALWSTGWWPRFALLTPDNEPLTWRAACAVPEPAGAESQLRRLYSRLPLPTWPAAPAACTVPLSAEAEALWQTYSKSLSFDLLLPHIDLDHRLHGSYGRLPGQALRVATLLAALDWPDRQALPAIDLGHMRRALAICERWRASAHRVLQGATASSFNRLQQRLWAQLAKYGSEGATLRDLARSIKDKRGKELESALEEMALVGQVETVLPASTKLGRPTVRYRLCRE